MEEHETEDFTIEPLIRLEEPFTLFTRIIYRCQVVDEQHIRVILVRNLVISNRDFITFHKAGQRVRKPCRCETTQSIQSEIVVIEYMQCVQPTRYTFKRKHTNIS